MSISITIFLDRLLGVVVPTRTKVEPGVLFYDMVLSQNGIPIVKFPFGTDGKLTAAIGSATEKKLTLYEYDSAIPNAEIYGSCDSTVGRFIEDRTVPLHFNVYKVFYVPPGRDKQVSKMGYRSRIGHNSVQDVPVFTLDVRDPGQGTEAFRVVVGRAGQTREPIEELPIFDLGPHWETQRPLFGTCHYASSNELQFLDLRDIVQKFVEPHRQTLFEDGHHLLKTFLDCMGGAFVFESDAHFEDPTLPNDAGDTKLELSGAGDCEDFTHFYMRTIRLLLSTFSWLVAESTSIHVQCTTLLKHYIPFAHVCLVHNSKKRVDEYHCTMLLVPKRAAGGYMTKSLEVTDPLRLSFDTANLTQRLDFHALHVASYFLVDSLFLLEIKNHAIDDLTVKSVLGEFINY
jgi:hypothetical protein